MSIFPAQAIVLILWMTLDTNNQEIMDKLGTLMRLELRGIRAARRIAHMQETTGSAALMIVISPSDQALRIMWAIIRSHRQKCKLLEEMSTRTL